MIEFGENLSETVQETLQPPLEASLDPLIGLSEDGRQAFMKVWFEDIQGRMEDMAEREPWFIESARYDHVLHEVISDKSAYFEARQAALGLCMLGSFTDFAPFETHAPNASERRNRHDYRFAATLRDGLKDEPELATYFVALAHRWLDDPPYINVNDVLSMIQHAAPHIPERHLPAILDRFAFGKNIDLYNGGAGPVSAILVEPSIPIELRTKLLDTVIPVLDNRGIRRTSREELNVLRMCVQSGTLLGTHDEDGNAREDIALLADHIGKIQADTYEVLSLK
jgi:hypothetical protein